MKTGDVLITKEVVHRGFDRGSSTLKARPDYRMVLLYLGSVNAESIKDYRIDGALAAIGYHTGQEITALSEAAAKWAEQLALGDAGLANQARDAARWRLMETVMLNPRCRAAVLMEDLTDEQPADLSDEEAVAWTLSKMDEVIAKLKESTDREPTP
jgi:hypothetical protein